MNAFDGEYMKEFKVKEIHLRPLFFLQEKLDKKIMYRALDNPQDEVLKEEIKRKKAIAFKTEVGELLNELRLHKYWSRKQDQNRDKILEEYVDGFHFLLSVGIDKGITSYDYVGMFDEELTGEDLVYIFEELYLMDLYHLKKKHYERALELYIKLGQLLLFSWEDIKNAYVLKNMENHDRQERKY